MQEGRRRNPELPDKKKQVDGEPDEEERGVEGQEEGGVGELEQKSAE